MKDGTINNQKDLFRALEYETIVSEMIQNKIIKKVALVGDYGVGKTSLTRRFVENAFSEMYTETIGVNIAKKELTYISATGAPISVILYIWDIFGTHYHNEVRRLAFDNVDAAVIVGDLSNKESIKSIQEFWIPTLLELGGNKIARFALNKMDLFEDRREEALSTYNNFLSNIQDSWNFRNVDSPAILTSAKHGTNVQLLFTEIGKRLLSQSFMEKKTPIEDRISYQSLESSADTYEGVFDRILFDILDIIKDRDRAQVFIQECHKISNINIDSIIYEELLEFIQTVSDNLASFNIPKRTVSKYVKEWISMTDKVKKLQTKKLSGLRKQIFSQF